ncbi:MAG: LamG-like jellyroll fold domain-containing protein, partial [Balneola sp.]
SSQSGAQFAFAGGVNYNEIQISGANGVRFITQFGNSLDNPARVDNGEFHLINSIAKTTGSELGIDGVYVSKSGDATHSVDAAFHLGTRADGSYRLDGDIAEIIVYNRKLTSTESMQVSEYLKDKYSTDFTAYAAPGTPAGNLSFSTVTPYVMNLNLSKGSGSHRLIIARKGSAVNAAPTIGVSYSGNLAFGLGDEIGSGNYVMYAGTAGTSNSLTNLIFDETYHFAVYEYNLVNGFTNYSVVSTASQATPNLTQSSNLQISGRTGSSFSGTLTPGNGSKRLIVARQSGAVNWGPTDGVDYFGNTSFGSGSEIGTGNYVIYDGDDGSSFTINSLAASTAYHLAVFEFTYENGVPKYRDSNPPTASDITFPGTPASNVQFSGTGLNEMTVSFTPGNGNKRIVIARSGTAVSATPVNGQSYTGNSVFGSGTNMGSENYVIYNGTGSSVALTGLDNSTTYHFAVYEYSEYNGVTSYLTSSPTTGSNSTTIVPLPVISGATFGTGTSTSREITGLVNPNGYETTVEIIYGTDDGNLNSTTASHSIGSGIVNVADTVDVTGLITGQTYYAKIRATNIRGSVESPLVTLVPLTFTSLQGWFRGDIVELNQFGTITKWVDYSGSTHHLTVRTNNTTQIQSGINGKPVANFSNSAFRFLPSDLEILNTDLEMFFVFKSSSNAFQELMSQSITSDPVVVLNSNNEGIQVNPKDGYQTEVTSGALNAYTNGNGHIMHYKMANNRYLVRMDNEEFHYKTGLNRFVSDDQINLGGKNNQLNGQIAEILFFNAELSFEQRQEVTQYLSDRYAISMYIPTVPETTANGLSFANVGATNFDVNFTIGSGERRIVVARLNGSAKTAPTNNTVYTANATFGSGSNLGNNNYVVYDGTGNSVAVTGLTANSEYTIDVYEYNNMELDPQYMLSSPNSATQATQSVSPPTIQLSTISSLGNNTVTIPSLINPNGFQATIQVSYGTNSESLSSSTTAQVVGSQSTAQAMSTALIGLAAGTKYYYKVSATNIGGTTESSIDSLFTGYYVNQVGVSLPSLQFWVAGDGATYTANSGDPVSNWANQTAEVTSAYQNLSEYRPNRITDSGVSFLRFDGNAGVKFLEMGTADSLGILNSNYEIFMVARSSSTNIGFLMGGTVGNFEIHTRPDGGVGTRFIPKSGLYVDSPVNSTDGNFHIFNAKATSTKAMLRIDGNSTFVNQDARSGVVSELLMGARRDGTPAYNFDGDIAEILIYNTGLSDSESLLISQYLANKYSITLTPFITPTEQASSVVFSNYVDGGITVSATAGNGTNRLFVMRESGTAAVAPTNGVLYTASSAFGSGSVTGTGNYVVSASSAISINVTGLTADTEYVVDVYEFNQAGSDPKYLTNSPASGSMQALDFDIYDGKIVYVVTGISDTNTGSGKNGTLRYVMNSINTHASDSTSLIDMRLLEGTITLTSDLPPVNYNTVIVGSGKEDLTVSGNNLYRPFFVGAGTAPFTAEEPASPNVTLKDFTIANGLGKGGNGHAGGGGAAGMGGALFINAGAITLENLSFSSNEAQGGTGDSNVGGSGGGGGFGGDGGSSIAGSSGYLGGTVPTTAGSDGGPGAGGFGNAVIVGDGGFGAGGASANNLTTTAGITIGGDGGFGGGGGAHGSIQTNSYTAIQGQGGFGAGSGIRYGDFDVRGGGGAGLGGAIFNRNGSVIIRNSIFTNNNATGGLGGHPNLRRNGSGYGGAIFNYQGVVLESNVTYGSAGEANLSDIEANFYDYNASNIDGSVISILDENNVTSSTVTVNAEITTFGVSGTYSVSHGTVSSNLSESTNTVNYNGDNSKATISVPLSGLDFSSQYYYKINVTNEFGTFESEIQSVTISPINASSSPLITSISTTSIGAQVTKGNGTHRLIVARTGSTVNASPAIGQTYTANSVFGSGAELGSGNFVIYSGSDSTFSISGLSAGATYHFSIFEFNSTTEPQYLTSSVLTFSETTLSALPAGLSGSSITFGGNDEKIMMSHGPEFNSTAVTMELWFKSDDAGTDYDFLTSKDSEELEIHLGADGVANTIRFIPASQVYIDSEPGVFTAGEWTHLAVVYDPANALAKMYVNGAEVTVTNNGTNPLTTPRKQTTSSFYLGSRAGSALYFNGSMDEVRIWNSVRTEDEIRAFMHRTIETGFQDLIAYWQFNEGSGTTLADKISGLDGTLQDFEFNANNGWADSDIAFGSGVFTAFNNKTSGSHTADDLVIALTDDFDNSVDLTVAHMTNAPNVLPSGTTKLLEDEYWVVQSYGTAGSFSSTLTFTVPESLTSGGQLNVEQFRLYRRNITSTGGWVEVSNNAASASSTTISFNGISEFGQFTIGRVFEVNFDQFSGNALKFDGVNDYIAVAHNDVLNVDKYTMELWFKWNNSGAAVEFLAGKAGSQFEIHLGGSSNAIRYIPHSGMFVDSPAEAITPGEWTHLAVLYDPGSSTAKMYINGVDINATKSSTNFATLVSSTAEFNIGRRQVNRTLYFTGEMDEIRIWKTIRTPQQIVDGMNGTIPSGFDTDLVGYWQFNEGTGTSTAEKSAGLVGTLLGFDQTSASGWKTSGIPISETVSMQLTGSQGWRLMASPVKDSTYKTLLDNIWTQGFTGADYTGGAANVFTWSTENSTSANTNWTPISDISSPFTSGSGSLVYIFNDDNGPGVTGGTGFPKTLDVKGFEPQGDRTLTSLLNTNINGFTLLGNPLRKDVDWDDFTKSGLSSAVYVYDHNAAAWKNWNGTLGSLTDGKVGAFNGFFVQTIDANPSLVIPTTARQDSAKNFIGKEAANANPYYFSLELKSDSGFTNKAWFQFSEEGEFGIDASDAHQLNPLSSNYVTLASILNDTTHLDINSLPIIAEPFEISLALQTSASGTIHRISKGDLNIPEGWEVSLFDSELDITTDLDEAYVFTMNTAKVKTQDVASPPSLESVFKTARDKKSSSRFILTVSPSQAVSNEPVIDLPTEVELGQNYPNPFNPSTTIAYGVPNTGKVTLEVFDILGRKVATLLNGENKTAGRYTLNFNASNLASGMYIYRLRAGNVVMIKKFTLIK